MFRRVPVLRVSPSVLTPSVSLMASSVRAASTRLRMIPSSSTSASAVVPVVPMVLKRWSGSGKWMPDAPRYYGEKRPRNNDPVVDENGNFIGGPPTDEEKFGTDWNDPVDRMRDYGAAVIPPGVLYFFLCLYWMHEEHEHEKKHPRPYFPSPYWGQPVNMPWKNWKCSLFDAECHAYFNLKRKLKKEALKSQGVTH